MTIAELLKSFPTLREDTIRTQLQDVLLMQAGCAAKDGKEIFTLKPGVEPMPVRG